MIDIIYINLYSHPQTDCFILSELFSMARHVGRSKPGSKPIQLYVRLSLRPLDIQNVLSLCWRFLLWQHPVTYYKTWKTNSDFCLNFRPGEAHTNMEGVWQIKKAENFSKDPRMYSVRDKNSAGCPRDVMVKVMDCGIVVREFVLQSRYYVHFRANTLGKGMNPLILPAMG